jgi:hypothetical protein
VKLSLLALSLTMLVPGSATAMRSPGEAGPTWACASRTSADGVDVSVVRTIDADGQQRKVSLQWSATGLDRGRLILSAMQTIPGAGDPPVRPKELLVSWSGFPAAKRETRMLIVLHHSGEPPNPLDGTAVIPYMDGLIGTVISWQRVRALVAVSRNAQISLIEPEGRMVRTASLDLGFLRKLRGRIGQAVEDSRAKAASFRKSCEPVTGG